jgi:hypothetical protein
MGNKYIITESQCKELIERKKVERVVNVIIEDIEKHKKYLKENISIESAVKDVLKKYYKKGVITESVKSKLSERLKNI